MSINAEHTFIHKVSYAVSVYTIIHWYYWGTQNGISFDTRGAGKSLARPERKKQLDGRHFSPNVEVIASAETWLDRQPSELFLSGLQKLQFGRCSLFPSWSG